MTDTRYVLTALPHSADASSPFHVSVVVSPRLSPDGTLADFPIFESWTTELAAGDLTVTDHTGVPFTITVLPVDDPANWKVVFPPTTPVLGFEPQSFEGKEWHSYAAGRMDLLAKVVHLVSLASDPIDPPLPSASPLGPTIGRLADQLWRDRERPRTDRLFWLDETRLTRFLDSIREESSSVEPILGMLIDLHEVRRFYERPESAPPEYLTKPVPGAENVRPKPMEPDFHQRVALLGDQPTVLRQLGLVIDVSVAELDRLAAARWLTARLVLADGTDPTIATRVACQVDEGLFTTVPRSGDWNGGRLRLGDSGRFSVLDLDPDASGLKLERFVVSVPRLSDIEENKDPVSAAPPTLQAQGFMVARNDRLDQLTTHLAEHQARASSLGSPAAPLLNTEDVNRGTRVEVWDDKAKGWFSLHLRSNQYTLGGEVTVDVAREEGFLQGAAAQETPADKVRAGTTPKTYLGEALFGWSGWSLSAPHPALRPEFRYDGPQGDGAERTEKVGEASEAPAANSTNVVSRPKVLGGSLPRLRYGRSYAFRAWGVDLAGNSPPRPEVPPSLDGAVTMADVAAAEAGAESDGRVGVSSEAARGELVARRPPPDPYRELARLWRAEARRLEDLASTPAGDVDPTQVVPSLVRRMAGGSAAGTEGASDDVTARLVALVAEQRRRAQGRFASSPRAERVRRAVRAIIDSDEPMVSITMWTPATLAALAEVAGGLALAADTVTPLRPLLRWHPLDPPAVVPRRAYAEGESVRHLVIRSGVEVVNDPEAGDTITVVDPTTYAAQVAASHPEIVYHDTCERHLAPPKASLPDAELHGRFDKAIGSNDPVDHQTALLTALREAGTFFDLSIPSLTDPGTPLDITYLRLEAATDADPTKLVDLETLEPGEPLGPGQYLVADTEQLELPYLPDSLATGVSLRFHDAGLDRPDLRFASGIEGMVADLHGAWPALEPYRLVLRGGAARGEVVDNVIDVALPAGDTLRARLASSMDPSSLTLFGVWNLLPPVVRADPEVERAAADGWLWALTPSQEVRFVHAVPRPLEAPRPIRVVVLRLKDSTGVFLIGGVDLARSDAPRASMPTPRGPRPSTISSRTDPSSGRSPPPRSPPRWAPPRTCSSWAASTRTSRSRARAWCGSTLPVTSWATPSTASSTIACAPRAASRSTSILRSSPPPAIAAWSAPSSACHCPARPGPRSRSCARSSRCSGGSRHRSPSSPSRCGEPVGPVYASTSTVRGSSAVTASCWLSSARPRPTTWPSTRRSASGAATRSGSARRVPSSAACSSSSITCSTRSASTTAISRRTRWVRRRPCPSWTWPALPRRRTSPCSATSPSTTESAGCGTSTSPSTPARPSGPSCASWWLATSPSRSPGSTSRRPFGSTTRRWCPRGRRRSRASRSTGPRSS